MSANGSATIKNFFALSMSANGGATIKFFFALINER